MIHTFRSVNIRYLGTPAMSFDPTANGPVMVPVDTATMATVQAYPTSLAWGTAVLTVYRSNTREGPWEALSSPITIGPGAAMGAAIDVSGFGYLAVGVSTAEGAEEFVTIHICLRGSDAA